MRILLAEDDEAITALVSKALDAEGFTVECCNNGPDTWERGDLEPWSAVILDLGLPGLDGLTLLKRWRRDGNQVPVLVLTARGSWMERVDGFDAGADDYLPKPFRTEELVARLRAILRRAKNDTAPVKKTGRFVLDEERQRILFDGNPVELTQLEYRAVAHLAANAGRAVSQMDLAMHLQGRDDDGARNAVEAMIARIRRKTAPEAIQTRRGFGYMLAVDDE